MIATALVDQYPAIDAEQASGGSRLSHITGWNITVLRARADTSSEQQSGINGYPIHWVYRHLGILSPSKPSVSLYLDDFYFRGLEG
jgi:hypothetical protein